MRHGCTEWATVVAMGYISRRKFSHKREDDSKISHVFWYIFSPDVTQLLAWRTIRLKVGSTWKVFPGVVHKISRDHMWRDYMDRALQVDGASRDIYGRSVFQRLVRMITRGELKRKCSV